MPLNRGFRKSVRPFLIYLKAKCYPSRAWASFRPRSLNFSQIMKISVLVALVFGLLFSRGPLEAQNSGSSIPAPPHGLYLLSDRQVPVDRMTIPSFISGYSLRIAWRDLETSKGVYDFSVIKNAIVYLQAHDLKMTLEIFSSMAPDYVLSAATSTIPVRRGRAPAPWDVGAQASWRAMLKALSDFQVWDASCQKQVPLRDHPALTAMDAPVVGLQAIRDVRREFVKNPDYDRDRFLDAIVASVRSSREAFPHDYGFLAFFRMEDDNRGEPLDAAIFNRIQNTFMGPGQAGLGLFQELWSDEGPNPETLGVFLLKVKTPNAVLLQSLTSWKRPFTDARKVASGNPAEALARANREFGCRYFELYSADVRAPDLKPVFDEWAHKLDPEGSARRKVPRMAP